MPRKYIPVQFAPIVYPDWAELFDVLTVEERAEMLNAIARYPNYNPDNKIWPFIKSQLDKQFQKFENTSATRSKSAQGNKGEQGGTNATPCYPMLPHATPGEQMLANAPLPIPEPIPEPIKEKVIKKKKPTDSKSSYGEFRKVLLTDEEYNRALGKYDNDDNKLRYAITILDEYIAQDVKREKRYTSHYAVLTTKTNWVRRRVAEEYIPARHIEKNLDDTITKVF